MKSFQKILGTSFTLMNDGVQLFNSSVVTVLESMRAWDNMYYAYKTEHNGVNYYIVIGGSDNARYFKTDGQKYCTSLIIEKNDNCYLKSCLCSWAQKEIQPDVERFKAQIEKIITETPNKFDEEFLKACKDYPWQTALTIENKTYSGDRTNREEYRKLVDSHQTK